MGERDKMEELERMTEFVCCRQKSMAVEILPAMLCTQCSGVPYGLFILASMLSSRTIQNVCLRGKVCTGLQKQVVFLFSSEKLRR